MSKMYYVSYETAKEKLNLNSENENDDRISLAFCNQLVKDAIEDAGVPTEKKQEFLEAIVLNVYKKYQEHERQNETQLVETFNAVKDALVWM